MPYLFSRAHFQDVYDNILRCVSDSGDQGLTYSEIRERVFHNTHAQFARQFEHALRMGDIFRFSYANGPTKYLSGNAAARKLQRRLAITEKAADEARSKLDSAKEILN